jgi:hypothetical protein
MTGEKRMFSSYVRNKDPQYAIIFRDRNQGKVKGLGKIVISTEHSISNVFWWIHKIMALFGTTYFMLLH